MKVLLIWPFGACDGLTMPLCYLYLLPILQRAGHEARLADCALDGIAPESDAFRDLLQEFQPDVVGVSAWTIHRVAATKTLQAAKDILPGVITVAGGPHFTSTADYSVKHDRGAIDFVFKGESEETFPQFLDVVAKTGTRDTGALMAIRGLCFVDKFGLVHENAAVVPEKLDSIGQPDYGPMRLREYLARGYRYRTSHSSQAPILTTRGCPYTCDFCAAPFLNGRKVRQHSIPYLETLIDTLWTQFGIRHFNIIDDNFTFDVAYAKRFCHMVISNHGRWPGITFLTPNGIRIERTDAELFQLMYAAGWRRVIVAPESGSQRMVGLMAKHLDLSIVPGKVADAQAAGLEVEGFFIIGHPGEDESTVAETEAFMRAVPFDAVSVHYFQPLPGTPIHNTMVMQGTVASDLRMTSFGDVNWVPEGWTKEGLVAAATRLAAAAAETRGRRGTDCLKYVDVP